MCGIVGIHSKNKLDLSKDLTRMNRIQTHRGPDSSGEYINQSSGVALAMRRLSIIDIESGSQPLISKDKNFILVYNGEIYNAPDLRLELEDSGEVFVTKHSDTEVLFKILIMEGVKGLRKLNGMFAFAFYNVREGKIIIGRDNLGIKPLYYTLNNEDFYFSSELKSFKANLKNKIDEQSLFNYLSLMYVPGGDSIFKDIKKIDPGSVIIYNIKNRSLKTESFSEVAFSKKNILKTKSLESLIYDNFILAVERWSYSDVPIACALSGGLDSSSILGALNKLKIPVDTYSLGYEKDVDDKTSDLFLAKKVANYWNSNHTEIILDPKDFINELNKMIWSLDEPYGGGLPSWFVFKEMSKKFKVGLTGTGGDELFGNYGKWRPMYGNIITRSNDSENSFKMKFFDIFYYFKDALKRKYIKNSSNLRDTSSIFYDIYKDNNSKKIKDKVAFLDIKTQLPEEFLLMTDRFSMYHSLEVRTPFLDKDFVDFVLSIPSQQRTKYYNLKGLLKKSLSPLIPKEVLNSPKKGFTLPLDDWLRNDLKPIVMHFLSPSFLKEQDIFNESLYYDIILPFLEYKLSCTTKVFGLLMFQLWYNQNIMNKDMLEPVNLFNES